MKFNELQNRNLNELQELAREAKVRLGKFRFELANKTLKDSSQLKKTKKEIAQILTAINKNIKANQ